MQEAVEVGQRASNAYAATGVRAELAWALATCGRLEEALAVAQEATAEAERSYRSARGWTAAILVRILLLRGDLPAAEDAFTLGGVGATDNMLNDASLWGGVAIGVASVEMEMARGDLEACQAAIGRLKAHLTKIGDRIHLQDALLLGARVLLAQNHLAGARLALQEARQLAQEVGSRRLLWMILDAQAVLEQSAGDMPAADKLRRQAREAVDSVAQHISDDSRKEAFLASPRVAALVTKSTKAIR